MRYHKVLDIHLTGDAGETLPYESLESLVIHSGGSDGNIGESMQAELMAHEISPERPGRPARVVKAVKPYHPWHDALCIVVTCAQLAKPTRDDLHAEIITTWLVQPGKTSKIRFFADGDGAGNVTAKAGARPVPAENFVDWLDKHDLRKSGVNNEQLQVPQNTVGLATIALASCLGGRYGLNGGVYDAAKGISPAPNSAIDRLVRALRRKDFRGIEVTGTTEMLDPLGPQERTGWQWVVELFQSEWTVTTLPSGQAQIQVPQHWTLRAEGFRSGGTIGFPRNYRMTRIINGWRVEPPVPGGQPFTIPLGSWVVDAEGKRMAVPVGWTVAPNPLGGGTLTAPHGSSVFDPPLTRPDMNRRAEGRLAHSPQKVRGAIS